MNSFVGDDDAHKPYMGVVVIAKKSALTHSLGVRLGHGLRELAPGSNICKSLRNEPITSCDDHDGQHDTTTGLRLARAGLATGKGPHHQKGKDPRQQKNIHPRLRVACAFLGQNVANKTGN